MSDYSEIFSWVEECKEFTKEDYEYLMPKEEKVKPPYKGMEGTYHIAKSYTEVKCTNHYLKDGLYITCDGYVAFRDDSELVTATMCPKCKIIIERPKASEKEG